MTEAGRRRILGVGRCFGSHLRSEIVSRGPAQAESKDSEESVVLCLGIAFLRLSWRGVGIGEGGSRASGLV